MTHPLLTATLLLLCSTAQAEGRTVRAPALNAVKDPKTVTIHASFTFHSSAAQENARRLQAKYGPFPPVRGGDLRGGGGRGGR